MNFQAFQVALVSYLSSLGYESYFMSTDNRTGAYINYLNIKQDATKTNTDRYIYSIKITLFNDNELKVLQEGAESIVNGSEDALNGLLNGYRVALCKSNGLLVNINEVEGAPFYGVALNLEITIEKE